MKDTQKIEAHKECDKDYQKWLDSIPQPYLSLVAGSIFGMWADEKQYIDSTGHRVPKMVKISA